MGVNWGRINQAMQGGMALGLRSLETQANWEKSQREKAEYERTLGLRADLAAVEEERNSGAFTRPAAAITVTDHPKAQGDFKPGAMVTQEDLRYQGRQGNNLPNVAVQTDTTGPAPVQSTVSRPEYFDQRRYLDRIASIMGKYGDPSAALKLREEAENEPYKAYQRLATQAYQRIISGDAEGGVKLMEEAYNRFLPDGRVARARYNNDGTVTYMTYDEKTGNPVGQPRTERVDEMTAQLMMLTNPEAWSKVQDRIAKEREVSAKVNSETYQARLAFAAEMMKVHPNRYKLEKRNLGNGREGVLGVFDGGTGRFTPIEDLDMNANIGADGAGGPAPSKITQKETKTAQEIMASEAFMNQWKPVIDKMGDGVLGRALSWGVSNFMLDPAATEQRASLDQAMRFQADPKTVVDNWYNYTYAVRPTANGLEIAVIGATSADTPKLTSEQRKKLVAQVTEKYRVEAKKGEVKRTAAEADKVIAERNSKLLQLEEKYYNQLAPRGARGAPAESAAQKAARRERAKQLAYKELYPDAPQGKADGGPVGLTDEELARLDDEGTLIDRLLAGNQIGSRKAIEYAEDTAYRRRRDRNAPVIRPGKMAKDLKTRTRVNAREMEEVSRMADGGQVKVVPDQFGAELKPYNPPVIQEMPVDYVDVPYEAGPAMVRPAQAVPTYPPPRPDRGFEFMQGTAIREDRRLPLETVAAPAVAVTAKRTNVLRDGFGRPVKAGSGGPVLLRMKDFL